MSKPTLYIHIGPHKTGTTSIQQGLVKNTDALAQQNYIYPEAVRTRFGHHKLVGELNNMYWHDGIGDALNTLVKAVSGLGKNVILSSETFFEIQDTAPLEKLKTAFAPEFDIKIIPYLRAQQYLMSSLWKTEIRIVNTSEPFDVWLDNTIKKVTNFHYDQWLALYERVFGQASILPQIYKPDNPQHFSSFLKTCGIRDISEFRDAGHGHRSFSDYQYMLFYGLFFPDIPVITQPDLTDRLNKSPDLKQRFAARIEKERRIVAQINFQISKFLDQNKIDQSGSLFTRPLLNKVIDIYRNSNQGVSRKYFGRDNIFIPDTPPDLIERNFLRRLSKIQLMELSNVVLNTYRRVERNLDRNQAV